MVSSTFGAAQNPAARTISRHPPVESKGSELAKNNVFNTSGTCSDNDEIFLLTDRKMHYYHHVMKIVTKCGWCRKQFTPKRRGRPRVYCSASCRQRAYERRCLQSELGRNLPIRILRDDLIEVKTRAGLHSAVISILREVGLLPRGTGGPEKKPSLHIVKNDDE